MNVMIAMAVALWMFAAPVLLGMLFPLAIQYKRGGWFLPFMLLAGVLLVFDVLLNFTSLALLTLDVPRKGEWTFSQRLSRLIHRTDWRGNIARRVAAYLNRFDPHHVQ